MCDQESALALITRGCLDFVFKPTEPLLHRGTYKTSAIQHHRGSKQTAAAFESKEGGLGAWVFGERPEYKLGVI